MTFRTAALAALLSATAQAAALKGYISDAACGWNNAREGKEAKECAQKCVRAGWDPVFVPDGGMNTYKIRQKAAALKFVGEHVEIAGKLEGDTVSFTSIRKSRGK